MLTQSLNHILLLSFAHTITPSKSFSCHWYTQSLNRILLLSLAHTVTSSHTSIITYSNNHVLLIPNTLHTQSFNHSFKHPMLTQSLNHVLLLSFAHTIIQTHPSSVLGSQNHSIASFYCPLHILYNRSIASFYCPWLTQSLNRILLLSLAQTNTQTHPSTVLCTHNHSITSFYCFLHTQSPNHILLLSCVHTITSSHPSNLTYIEQLRPFYPKYPTHTITQSYLSNIPCSHNH
jgi:hypothetical protein